MHTTPTKRGLLLESGKTTRPAACIIRLSTGYCGEDWCEQILVHASEDLDELARERAYEHATSYGSEGECVCSGCNADDGGADGDFCNEEDCNGVYVYHENENICGLIYKIQPSRSLDYVNGGSDWSEIFEWAKNEGIISFSECERKVLIYKTAMEQFLYLPDQKEWDILLKELMIVYSTNSVEYA